MRNRLITIILTAIILAVPIATMPGAGKANIPRIFILLVGGLILLILMLTNYKKLKLDRNDYIILIFVILIFIATINSSNIKTSIIGTHTRYEGMLALYTYIIIYFCAKKFLIYKNKNTLLLIIQVLYIIISVLGILQYYIKLPTNTLYPIFNKGIGGTFGNTNFMGNFISMGIPVFIITYIIKGNKISFITSLTTFFCLIGCLARSGWVAFAVFSLIMLVYIIKNRNRKYIIRSIILIICFIIIFAGMYLSKNDMVKQRVATVKNEVKIIKVEGVQNNTGSNRIQIWKITCELILKYPWLGVGTDNLKIGILENLTDTSINYILRTGTLIDKAHNEYLQIAVTLGIPALIVYFIFITNILFKKRKEVFRKDETFIICSVIVSYLVQAFFNISTVGVAPLFWLSLGLLDNKMYNEK